jgi:hypothetical protein
VEYFSFSTVVAYYSQINKEDHKAWKSLNADEKKAFIKMLDDVSISLIYF